MQQLRTSRRHVVGMAVLAALAGIATAPATFAQTGGTTAATIPLADFFKRPQYTQMVASPNGRYLATTASSKGRLNLVVLDLQDRKAVTLTDFDDIDVGRLQWANNDYILFSAIQVNAPTGAENPRAGGLFSVALDGSGITRLAKTARQLARSQAGGFMYMEMVRPLPASKTEVIAAAVVANDDSADLYRVDVSNGKYKILTQGRPTDRIQNWLLDSKNVPRVAVSRGDGASTSIITHYRAGPDAPWKELNRFDTVAPPAFVPLAFDDDDKHLIVASNANRANMAIFRFNPENGQFVELIAQHPQYDLGGSPQGEPIGELIRDRDTHAILGMRIDADKYETIWFDADMAKAQATLDASLPGRTNLVRRSAAGKPLLVYSFSDTSPGRFYLFHQASRNIEEIGPSRPWLEGKLANVKPFRLKTRDGLEIPSSVVLPKGYKAGDKLPTIVHVHGGPMGRDVRLGGLYGGSFGVQEAQILASRGYAVVLPNFRVTPEIGSKIYYAGFGSYGQQMSDDHEDAAKWAIDQGFADPRRICISGASYGGYAALHAVSRPSNPFTCAISGLPVTDLAFQRKEADYAVSKAAVEYWRKLQGVKDWDDPLVRAMSPIHNADKIKVPVFMYIGDEDTRTPPDQARRMAAALEKAGNPVKGFYVGKGEGHGYGVEATNIALYEQMLKFLDDTFKR